MQTLFVLPCAAVAAGLVAFVLKRRPPASPAQTEAPLPQDDPGRFPLALTPEPDPVVITEKARFQHLEIVGSSGTGKNYHGLLPMIHQDMQRGAGLIILDPKGAMRRTITAYARACGRSKDLRCLDLADPATSDSYNPFLGDDPTLVAERAHAAFYADDATATSFYRDTALGFFYSFFALCRRLEALPTPSQLRAVAQDQGALASLLAQAPRSPEARDLRRLCLRQSPQDYAKTMQGVVNALTPLCQSAFAGLLNSTAPGIKLDTVLARGGILYVGLATDQYPAASKKVGTLLLMDLQSSLTKRYGTQAEPVFLYMDEFADLLYPQVRALISKAREARVGIVLAHQSLGDLQAHGKATAQAIFENTSNKILLRQGAADSAEALARLSGRQAPGERIHYALHPRGLKGDRVAAGLSASGVPEALFPPDALMNLAVGEAFLVVQHSRGRALYRSRLRKAPEAQAVRLRQKPSKAPLKAHKPLDLDLEAGDAPEGPGVKPTTPLAKAALERLHRSRNREP